MLSKSKPQIHPVADIFPRMSDEELNGLKEDIRANGLREPITFWKGQVIDGRNRIAACESINYDWTRNTDELDEDRDPVSYVISHNLHRRHLSTSQRAQVAGRLRGMFDEAAKDRMLAGKESDPMEKLPQGSKGAARDKAGEALNVSGKLVDAATTVLKKGSDELIAKVDRGEVSVTKAAKVAKSEPKEKQVEVATQKTVKPERGYYVSGRKLFEEGSHVERTQLHKLWGEWLEDSA